MLQILGKTQGNIIATKAMEELTASDYAMFLPILRHRIKNYKKIRWYFEMEDFKEKRLKDLFQDIKFDTQEATVFEKIAIVGEKQQKEWMHDLMKPFSEAEIKFFEIKDRNEAFKWIEK